MIYHVCCLRSGALRSIGPLLQTRHPAGYAVDNVGVHSVCKCLNRAGYQRIIGFGMSMLQ